MSSTSLWSRQSWILSPSWDWVLIIGTPLFCFALIAPLKFVFPSSEISLVLLAFFAVGHHLPTFMRAYGDSDLFQRFRGRFIGAPILVFAAALLCSFENLHGLLLITLTWEVWHALMQHYGFMRIYDAKNGETSKTLSRLDLWITILWFSSIILWSPLYSLSVIKAWIQTTGLPVPLNWLEAFRVILGIATIGITVVYAIYVAIAMKRGRPISLPKLALLALTIAFIALIYCWLDDLYLGYTMWAVYHDIQYFAIVWMFNRRKVEKTEASAPKSFLTFLFRKRASLLLLYMVLIFSYGGLSYTKEFMQTTWIINVIGALITTSTLLHYWYDGFIWKVREPSVREGLKVAEIEGESSQQVRTSPYWRHLAYFVAPMGLLAIFEVARGHNDIQTYRSLLETYPQRAEVHIEYARELRQTGENELAYRHFRSGMELTGDRYVAREAESGRRAVLAILSEDELRILKDDSQSDPWVRGRLGEVCFERGAYREALSHFEASDPEDPVVLYSKAFALAELGDVGNAIDLYRDLLERTPDNLEAHFNLALLLVRAERADEAARELRVLLEGDPDRHQARFLLGLALDKSGLQTEAEDVLRDYVQRARGVPEEAARLERAKARLNRTP